MYQPGLQDVLDARSLLYAVGLPAEIVPAILDLAEYWLRIESQAFTPVTVGGSSRKAGTKQRYDIVAMTPPLCVAAAVCTAQMTQHTQTRSRHHLADARLPRISSQHPARRITWSIRSRHINTYDGFIYRDTGRWTPFSSFEGVVFRYEDEPDSQLPDRMYLAAYAQLDASTIRWPRQMKDWPLKFNDDSYYTTGKQEVWRRDWPENHRLKVQYNLSPKEDEGQSTVLHTVVWHWLDHEEIGDARELDWISIEDGRGVATKDGAAVRALRVGDCVSLWACGSTAGRNEVMEASVSVEFML